MSHLLLALSCGFLLCVLASVIPRDSQIFSFQGYQSTEPIVTAYFNFITSVKAPTANSAVAFWTTRDKELPHMQFVAHNSAHNTMILCVFQNHKINVHRWININRVGEQMKFNALKYNEKGKCSVVSYREVLPQRVKSLSNHFKPVVSWVNCQILQQDLEGELTAVIISKRTHFF